MQHCRSATIGVAAILGGERDDVGGQRRFIVRARGVLRCVGSMLAKKWRVFIRLTTFAGGTPPRSRLPMPPVPLVRTDGRKQCNCPHAIVRSAYRHWDEHSAWHRRDSRRGHSFERPGRAPALNIWKHDATSLEPALFGKHARVPLKPFAGTIGNAPAERGHHSLVPPRQVGGNLDIRDLAAGSILYLPVEVAGQASAACRPQEAPSDITADATKLAYGYGKIPEAHCFQTVGLGRLCAAISVADPPFSFD